jgi:cephalosporin hydroxylase
MAAVHERKFRGRKVVGFMSDRIFARLAQLIDEYDVDSVIEIGAFVGLSTCWFAERVDSVITVDMFNAKALKDRTLDPYVQDHHRSAYHNQYPTFLANTLAYPNIRSIKMWSVDAARLPVEADMVYIDGSHSYEEALADIRAWRPHARRVLCGDDNWDKPHMGVKQALAEEGIRDSGERTWWVATS